MSTTADDLEPQMPAPPSPQRSLGQLFAQLSEQLSKLVKGELELAKTEAAAKVKRLGMGGVLLAIAGILGLYFLGLLMNAMAYGFASLVGSYSLGYLCAAAVVLVVLLIIALVGKAQLKKSSQHTIDPKGGLQESLSAFTDGVKKGVKKNGR